MLRAAKSSAIKAKSPYMRTRAGPSTSAAVVAGVQPGAPFPVKYLLSPLSRQHLWTTPPTAQLLLTQVRMYFLQILHHFVASLTP